jgi:hypothetical protein
MSTSEMQRLLARVSLEERAREIPLIEAVSNNRLREVKRLIGEGADINIQAPGGKKPHYI